MAHILVIDDDQAIGYLFSRLLTKGGFECTIESSPLKALALFRENRFDLVITDFYMPEMTGIELLEKVKTISPETDVIVMTAYASVDNAVEAMKRGAYDYLVKPFQNDDVLLSVKRVLEKRKLTEENRFLREELSKKYGFQNIIGTSPAMRNLFAAIKKVADSDATVLLLGESGTGKELVSRAIHFSGKRKDRNFVAVNCSALPDTLLESELFGHAKGAYTGAIESKQGLFEHADGGTLFLDEIADTSPSVQAKLLRIMQDKKIRKLGDTRETEVNVRIITATSKNLRKLIDKNTFREDLFYRINVFPLGIPSLRERREDIPLLVEHFLKGRKRIHPAALDFLTNHNWPGNVRELENMVERLVVFSGGDTIMPEDLPAEAQDIICKKIDTRLSYAEAKQRVIDEFNRNFIRKTLLHTEGNVTKAAENAKLDRANFQRLMRKYGIASTEFKENTGE
ncbi:MAG: sigma-54 dependent transcriptional regulator [Alphaproteobacteria bacterium]|uniref:Sigma-54 dependent transcriptional regulator n=1 Tax=Candidatus Nitrobium versatile TaxID=2884831 RepID=A0A953JGH3_9BACT|nr:sigma-54 dependent transcriptional regulator [Candidatus Nitrobium versatile]